LSRICQASAHGAFDQLVMMDSTPTSNTGCAARQSSPRDSHRGDPHRGRPQARGRWRYAPRPPHGVATSTDSRTRTVAPSAESSVASTIGGVTPEGISTPVECTASPGPTVMSGGLRRWCRGRDQRRRRPRRTAPSATVFGNGDVSGATIFSASGPRPCRNGTDRSGDLAARHVFGPRRAGHGADRHRGDPIGPVGTLLPPQQPPDVPRVAPPRHPLTPTAASTSTTATRQCHEHGRSAIVIDPIEAVRLTIAARSRAPRR
jgi:hypothetical protein